MPIGRWSYSIYVLHGPVLWAVTAFYGYVDGSIARLVLSTTVVPLTIAVSALNYAYVERPFIDLGRFVTSRLWIWKISRPVSPGGVQLTKVPAPGAMLVPPTALDYFPAQNWSFSAVVNCARRRKTRRG
jgi:hypothetical protein